jgi:hypothetical protein
MGRPPVRAAASALALAGIDTTACDPREVLRSIALDASAPHSARVQAAKALLLDEKSANPMKTRASNSKVVERAIHILAENGARSH